MSKMKKCKACSKEIATNAKSCPGCGTKNKKPVYKRVWFWVVAAIIAVGAASSSDTNNSKENNSGNVESVQEVSQSNDENSVVENKLEDKDEDNIPTEYKSALRKAKSYNNIMHMSKAELYDQLTSEYGESFTVEAAQYAVDNVEVDWKENALKKAESYANNMHMSKAGVYDQLTSEHGEQFTPEEAQYAIDNVDADWKQNALKKAESYQEHMAMSPSAIYDQLVSEYGEEFTAEEAQYAIDNLN